MPWYERLSLEGRGSFRNVEFLVDVAESEVGRRVTVHEYPGRSVPFVEDHGRATRRFKLTCFVVGPEYDVRRNWLLDEFEKEGPGQLVHPYWGEFTARVVSPVRVRETPAEGGVARFDLEVVEVADRALTTEEPDLEPVVEEFADAAVEKVSESFEESFSVAGAIEDVRSKASSAIQTLASKVRQARRVVNAALNLADSVGDAIDDLSNTAASLILAPAQLAEAVTGLAASVMGAITQIDSALAELIAAGGRLTSPTDGRIFDDFRADRALEAFRKLTEDPVAAGDLDEPKDTGSTQDDRVIANQRELVFLHRAAFAIEGARALASLEVGSRDQALAIRDEVAALLDAIASDDHASDQLWAALVDLRDAFARRMLEVAEALPQLIEHTPNEARPALCLAYDLHGDATRDFEIVARNAVKNPNFVPGGVPLQVVADE